MDDPIWISLELVLAFHARQLAEHGGLDGIRDQSLLESALARPRHQFACEDPTPSIPALAAAYAFAVAKNHPFLDGNKRTALVVSITFLELNGLEIIASMEDRYLTFYNLAAGKVTEPELIAWMQTNTRPSR